MPRSVIGARRRRTEPEKKNPKLRIRRGDRVRVIRGNYAGQEGTVMRVIPDRNRVVVEGVNKRTKHVRPTSNNEGGRITFEAPIHASNVMLIDPSTGEPTRVRMRLEPEAEQAGEKRSRSKERIAVKSGNPIPKPRVTK